LTRPDAGFNSWKLHAYCKRLCHPQERLYSLQPEIN
jgi:hypothetical protein